MPLLKNVGKEFLGIIEEAEGVGHEEDYQPTLTSNSFVAFPKLRELSFKFLDNWTTWTDPEHDNNIQFTIMPSLLDLSIEACDELQALPRFLARAPIKRLSIQFCDLIDKRIKEGCEGYGWVSGIPECYLTLELSIGSATISEEEKIEWCRQLLRRFPGYLLEASSIKPDDDE
ncbi:hypothetical protein Droror1_Dr00021429 [Drosera rotundifolia]